MVSRELVRELDDMLEILKRNVPDGDYHQGLYNGMELARSIITNEEAVFVEEDGSLDTNGVTRNPERFI